VDGASFAVGAHLTSSFVRGVLPAITVPTLVLHHAQATRIAPAHGRYIAERIKGARYVEVPGSENFMWAGDSAVLVGEIQEFLTGARPVPGPDRVLATLLFTDIVESTKRAAQLGDTRWRELLAEPDRDGRLEQLRILAELAV